jgi:hypothetical protein
MQRPDGRCKGSLRNPPQSRPGWWGNFHSQGNFERSEKAGGGDGHKYFIKPLRRGRDTEVKEIFAPSRAPASFHHQSAREENTVFEMDELQKV